MPYLKIFLQILFLFAFHLGLEKFFLGPESQIWVFTVIESEHVHLLFLIILILLMIFYLFGLTFILVDIRIANIFIFPTGVQLGLCYNLAFIIILKDYLLPISVPLEI